MRKIVLFLTFAALISGYAQNMASCDDEEFRRVMRSLVSKGNLYYETCDRFGINRMMDSIRTCIRQRSLDGKLDRMDSLEFTADWYKLQGSFHYENSFYDSTSCAKAHESYRQALDIYKSESAFDDDLRCEPMIHRELAQLYYKEKNYQEAFNHTKVAYDAFENAADLNEIDYDDSDYLDIQTQMAICQARMGNTKEAVTIIDKLVNRYDQKDVRYGEALRKKGKILMLQEESGVKVDRARALECYRTFFGLKKKDALAHFMELSSQEREQYWMRIRPFVTDCYRLEDADAGFLYDVTLFAKGLLLQLDSAGGGKQEIHATWQMVQEKLKPDACAIEFIQYEKYGKQQMGALVLKKTGNPKFVKLASPDSVLGYKIGEYTVQQRLGNTGKDGFDAINRVYNDSTGLYPIIWNEALLTAIGNSKKIFFSPDGYLHRIAIEYMLPESISQRTIYRLTSTRRLISCNIKNDIEKALIVGDVDFNATGISEGGDNDAKAFQVMKGLYFSNIKESKMEIDSIVNCRSMDADRVLTKELASENMFRTFCCDYPVLHISTHGKLMAKEIPFGTDLKPSVADESLSENIIALAGINSSLRDELFNPSENYDGIISAKEIASMDMQKVQLVILACCESGLGLVTPDGVYGIQRGLKNAGAGAIIMSLWEATSQTTTRFMIAFHKKIKNGIPIGEAFRDTRMEMWNQSEYYDQEPCYWNVFIMVDAIE